MRSRRSSSPQKLPTWDPNLPKQITMGRRRLHPAIVAIPFLLFLYYGYRYYIQRHSSNGLIFSMHPETVVDLDVPPTWDEVKKWEHDLPQHNVDLPYPEGRNGRYVFFKNEINYLGWNNVLNERLMNTYLAYKSRRAYVFQSYLWKDEYYPWPENKRPGILSTPLPAIISGPTAGGPWDPDDDAPRSVSLDYYKIVCPESERRIINTGDVKPPIMWENGDVIFRHWEKLLRDAPERCIEIQPAERSDDNFPQVFDLYLWGSNRILPLWDEFRDSPVSRLFATSPIVTSQVARNEYIFWPTGPRPTLPAARDPFKRTLAIHIRRGDYKEACKGLATWNSTFYSWNLLPSLPDKFIPPPGGSWGKNTPENEAFYFVHCLPTFDFIVKKIRDARTDYIAANPREPRALDVIYLLTNDESEWLDNLKAALVRDGWYTIRTTKDLTLTREGKEVGMAVDMDIARKAAVFIGNGWSSFTSNIVYRRMLDGNDPISNRFY